jgi:hypothetical protein
MGYTGCPRVAYDLRILKCSLAVNEGSCTFKCTNIPDIVWPEPQEVGKCRFCILEEEDKKMEKERSKRALGASIGKVTMTARGNFRRNGRGRNLTSVSASMT